MVAGDLIRLAWEAEHDGRTRLRDAALTLAIAESRPGDAWAERCRTRLIADRPAHYLASYPTVARALEDPRVIEARDRLRQKYPEPRVQSLLLRARAARGPYLGRLESLDAMIDDLAGPGAEAENVRRDAAQPSRGPIQLQRAARPLAFSLALPPPPTGSDRPSPAGGWPEAPPLEDDRPDPAGDDVAAFYLTVLLAIAVFLAVARERAEG